MRKPFEYDVLIVGAGVTAATLAALFRERRWRIAVVESRPHIGGSCFDYRTAGTLVHLYGPHVFHTSHPDVVAFLARFTRWIPYRHQVLAEIEHDGRRMEVPFPYSRRTAQVLGRELSESEITERFFQGYSEKMWQVEWQTLPAAIRRRIPRDVLEESDYYPGHFVALPDAGYTRMMENMFDGADLFLGAEPRLWESISAINIIYTGRPDLIYVPGSSDTFAARLGLELDYRTLDIRFAAEEWPHETAVLNCCSRLRPCVRRTCYAKLTGGTSPLVSTEYPRAVNPNDLSPTHPVPGAENLARIVALQKVIRQARANLHIAGRLGMGRYLDMDQAVLDAISVASTIGADAS